jgi:D-sedoheptulose 7-phosphate isomerase
MEGFDQQVEDYFTRLRKTVDVVPKADVATLARLLLQAYDHDKLVITMGNGGHGATASHFINDLSKHTVVSDRKNEVVVTQKRFRALCLLDNLSLVTAWANDTGYENVFVQQIANWVGEGDLVIAVSGSGNSENILRALSLANEREAITVGIAGHQGGKMKQVAQHCIIVPGEDDLLIEDMHLSIFHAVTSVVRRELQGRVRHES